MTIARRRSQRSSPNDNPHEPKLRGLSDYAEANTSGFGRIEAIARTEDGFRALDLTEPKTREAINGATSAQALFEGATSTPYDID